MTVVEDENEEGWSKVVTLDGRRGQVPASYLQINEEEAATLPVEISSGRQGTSYSSFLHVNVLTKIFFSCRSVRLCFAK